MNIYDSIVKGYLYAMSISLINQKGPNPIPIQFKLQLCICSKFSVSGRFPMKKKYKIHLSICISEKLVFMRSFV